MSEKEFEKLYQKTMEEETPDLWNRIETKIEEESKTFPRKKNTKKWMISFSTLAAAVVIFLIASPLFSTVKENQNDVKMKNISEGKDLASDKVSKEYIEETDTNLDKDNTNSISKDSVTEGKEITDKSENANQENGFEEKEYEKETKNKPNKIISTLEKEGITLYEADAGKIEGLSAITAKEISDELQSVVEKLEELSIDLNYFKDLEDIYYVELEGKLYQIIVE